MKGGNFSAALKGILAVLSLLILSLPLARAASLQTHPLRQIQPINQNLNMANNTAGTNYNITNIGWLNPGGVPLLASSLGVNAPSVSPGQLKVQSDSTYPLIVENESSQRMLLVKQNQIKSGLNINVSQNELRFPVIHKSSTPPSAVEGQIWFNTTSRNLMQHNGTQWNPVASQSANTFEEVLAQGNSAGSYSIDMNRQNIDSISTLNSGGSALALGGDFNADSNDIYSVSGLGVGTDTVSSNQLKIHSGNTYPILVEDSGGTELFRVNQSDFVATDIGITDLPTPSVDSDAATKGYVDQQAIEATQNLEEVLIEGNEAFNDINMTGYNVDYINTLNSAGRTLTIGGDLDLGGDNIDGVSTINSGGALLSVGQNISMQSNHINNLATPSQGSDAATKDYVDTGDTAASEDLEETLSLGNSAGNYNIDMNEQVITNIGATGTDFTSTGGLTLADSLTVSSGSVDLPSGVISNTELANSDVTVSSGTGLTGGGTVSLGGSTTLDLNTTYSDDRYVLESGDTMTGNLSFGGNQYVTNLPSPSVDSDAATKDYVDTGDTAASEDLEETLSLGNSAGNYNIDMSEQNINSIGTLNSGGSTVSLGGDLDMNGNNITLGNSGGTGNAQVEGSRELYAGDETEVTTTSTSRVLKKEMTMVFDSDYGKSPNYVNIIARTSSNGEVTVDIDGTTEATLSGDLAKTTVDTSGLSDGTHTVDIYLESTDGNEASHDIIEFYYVQ
ncbi:MAG: hypothetical protein ACLFTQ_03085 [Candidatus Aenigmatarchaeota archaeon]